jgi:hypothetical protein
LREPDDVREPEVFREPDDVREPEDLREPDDFREPADFREGTLAPLRRASLRPIAIACLRLFTVRPDPLFSVPRFRRRIVDSTFLDADLLYLAMQEPPLRSPACKRRDAATCRR